MALLATGALVVSACGGSSSKKAGGTTATSSGPDNTKPVQGGSLIVAIDAEEPGLLPPFNTWDNDGVTYGHALYDPIADLGDDGKFHPFLAQSIDHSADYKTWTIKTRPNIKFTNGDPVTAQTFADVINGYRKGPITATAYLNITDVKVSAPDTVDVTMQIPWVAFDAYLAGIFVFNPSMLADPKNSDHKPIGTGPFTLKEWVPGNHMTLVKNPNYWQQGKPYLDQIELRPIVDRTARFSTLQAGTVQAAIMDDPETVKNMRGISGIKEFSEANSPARQEINFIMLNVGKEPFNNEHARKAVALATDKDAIIKTIYADNAKPANQVYNSKFEMNTGDDAGYPAFNLDQAKAEVQAYTQATGKPLAFELGTVNDPKTLQAMQLVQSQWQKAGMQITLKQVEQAQYISKALVGDYQAYEWRQFGESDVDEDFLWWHSLTAADEGKLALNFSRNKDPQIDKDLITGRTNPDPAVRKQAYQDIARQLNKDLPFIYIAEIPWSTFFKSNVHGVVDWTFPDGTKGASYTTGGVQRFGNWFVSK